MAGARYFGFGLKRIFKFVIDVQKLFGKCAKNWPPETRPVVGEVACPCTQCCILSILYPVSFYFIHFTDKGY